MSFWDPTFEAAAEAWPELPELSEDDVKVALANLVRGSEQAQLVSYEARLAGVAKPGSTRCFQLRVNFRIKNENHHVKLVLKLQNQDSLNESKESMAQGQLFTKEVLFYGCVVPQMRALLPTNECELPVPECYLARSGALSAGCSSSPCCLLPGPAGVLVLQDAPRPARGFLDLPHLRLAVRSVARLHALSVALNRRGAPHHLALAQTFPALSQETLFDKQANARWFEQFTLAIEIFSVVGPMMNEEMLLPGRNISKVVPVMMKELWDILEDCLKPSFSQVNALCLNGCEISSFAFAYDDHKNARDCKIINFENVKYARPITDVVQIIYNCTQLDLQKDELDHILELYHDSFLSTTNKCTLKYHPSLPLAGGLLSVAELGASFRECRVLGAARRAVSAALACLFEQPPGAAAEELLASLPRLPTRAEARGLAAKAFRDQPHFRLLLYRGLAGLLECLAEKVECPREEPHRACPHPRPQ